MLEINHQITDLQTDLSKTKAELGKTQEELKIAKEIEEQSRRIIRNYNALTETTREEKKKYAEFNEKHKNELEQKKQEGYNECLEESAKACNMTVEELKDEIEKMHTGWRE